MNLRARYTGTCSVCGRPIQAGEDAEWDKATRTIRHPSCTPGSAAQETYALHGGSGYGCHGWRVGQTLRIDRSHPGRQHWPEYVTIVRATSRYIRDDGMSFGVGEDSGHLYAARARAATPEEVAPVQEALRCRDRRDAGRQALQALADTVQHTGERPPGQNAPEGERWFDTQDLEGGGNWWIIGDTWIWYVLNNGMDGDDWSQNNVRTGGAGAIGWRLPRTEALVAQLSDIRSILAANGQP